jgi:hypothetical protein
MILLSSIVEKFEDRFFNKYKPSSCQVIKKHSRPWSSVEKNMVRICRPGVLMTIAEGIAIYPIPAVIEIVPIVRIMKIGNGLKIN